MLWWKSLRGFEAGIKVGSLLEVAEQKPLNGWPIQRTAFVWAADLMCYIQSCGLILCRLAME